MLCGVGCCRSSLCDPKRSEVLEVSELVFTLAGRGSDFDPLCVNGELREWCSSLSEAESPGLV